MTRVDRPWFRRKRVAVPAGFLVMGIAAGIVWVVSPWPAALLIRAVFEKGATDTVAEMVPYVPTSGVDARRDLAYGDGGVDETFDLFRPSDADGPLPTVVWIHGGAWISGHKEDVDPYVQIIASHGYTTVSLNYTVGPEASYPVAVTQLNAALGHLVDNAADYGIDPDRIVIAGDSAGSQFTSQLATMITNPEYAELVGIEPTLRPDQLRGVILNCGIYDVSEIPNAPGIGGWGFRVALWSYLGDRNWAEARGGEEMSTLGYVTADFPATWISGGNDDPLTDTQSKPLTEKLEGLGVDVTSLFYPEDHVPALPHEYQFHLDYEDAQGALESTLGWLEKITAE